MESGRRLAARRRSTRTRRTRTASSRLARSRGTTGAPATTSSRSPTTGTAARRRRAPSSSCSRASSSTASCPRTATATCSGSGSSATRPSSRASAATSRRPATGSSRAGGVAYLAHPYWTGARAGGIELPPSVTGIEVFNAGCELEVGRGLSSVHWDELLQDGRLCPGARHRRQPPPRASTRTTRGRGSAPSATAESVLDALRTGRFYGSTGPRDPRRRGDRRRESSSGARRRGR